MKSYYGNYMGLCINNDDPQKRGRVQVFIPHIMPALFENWNEAGEDIQMLCVGDNLPASLPSSMVEKLKKILPWCEAASPILGTSAPGGLEGGNYTQFPDAVCPPGTSPVQVPGAGTGTEGQVPVTGRYIEGNIGPTSTGAHYDIKQVGRGYFDRASLDQYVQVNGGPLSGGKTVPGGRFGAPRSYGSHNGWDFAFGGGASLTLANGARWVGSTSTSNGDKATFELPDGRRFEVLHGRFEPSYSGTASATVGGGTLACYPTSTSGQLPAASPFSTDALNELNSPAIPTVGNTGGGGGTLSVPGVGQVGAGGGNVLSAFRGFANELQDPAVRQKLYTLIEAEVGSQGSQAQLAFLETVRNRAAVQGTTLNNIISNRAYYEPYQTGAINSAAARLTGSKINAYGGLVSQVLGGSNITNGATHNASAGVAASVKNGGYNSVVNSVRDIGGETFYSKTMEQSKIAQLLSAEGLNTAPATGTFAGGPGASTGMPTGSQVLNLDPHGPTPVINMNNMAAGVFSYPAAGALLWVFFREGNPLFPVYFAANYGQREWASAYRLGSDGVGYKPAPTGDNPVTSVGGTWNVGKVGVHQWFYTNDPTNPLNNERSYAIGGHDGSNIAFTEGVMYQTAQFDHRKMINGDYWKYVGGSVEELYSGSTRNIRNLGDTVVHYGNTSPEAVAAAEAVVGYINQIMQPLTQSNCGSGAPGGGGGSSSGAGPSSALPPNRRAAFNAILKKARDAEKRLQSRLPTTLGTPAENVRINNTLYIPESQLNPNEVPGYDSLRIGMGYTRVSLNLPAQETNPSTTNQDVNLTAAKFQYNRVTLI